MQSSEYKVFTLYLILEIYSEYIQSVIQSRAYLWVNKFANLPKIC